MHKNDHLGLYLQSESETKDFRGGENVTCRVLQRGAAKLYYPHFNSVLLQVTVASFENISPAMPSPRIIIFLPQQAYPLPSLPFEVLFSKMASCRLDSRVSIIDKGHFIYFPEKFWAFCRAHNYFPEDRDKKTV
jgi:hypothetical protein